MEKLKNIKIKELDKIIHELDLSDETRVSLTIEDNENVEKVADVRVRHALQQLKGSGTGSLLDKLLKERKEDKRIEKNRT